MIGSDGGHTFCSVSRAPELAAIERPVAKVLMILGENESHLGQP
ncbi:hypothetical protein ACWEDZ_35135 [Streptomyces sp. NPDC005047]